VIKKVRKIYRELMAFLSQTPKPKRNDELLPDDTAWVEYNRIVEELIRITGNQDYYDYLIKPEIVDDEKVVPLLTLRQKLGRLINVLYADYFYDEPEPFSGSSAKKSSAFRKEDYPTSNKVFIVHGHNTEIKESVARFIEKLDFDIVLYILFNIKKGGC
jgi:hypothetical protein